jgi:putative PIN family toxin of toxin-antitoxin system
MKPEQNKKPSIVFDTNALISAAILPKSASRKAFTLATQQFQLVASKATLQELIGVIERPRLDKYFGSTNTRLSFLMLIAQLSDNVETESTITDCRDPDDNKILELAVDAHAKIIVCGDNDLLVLNPFRGIEILRPHEFLARFLQEITS